MQNTTHPAFLHFQFKGEGLKLFGIFLGNFLLILITLGFYYPWARAKLLKYLYSQAEFNDSSFAFHGTGKEIFKGFIKAMGLFMLIYLLFVLGIRDENLFYIIAGALILLGVIPLAIHSALRYRLSRSSWKGVHFYYQGKLKEFMPLYYKNLLLTFFSLGFYYPWSAVNRLNYIVKHSHIGNAHFVFQGKGDELLILHLKGLLFSILTLGIYIPWYLAAQHRFYINHMSIVQEGRLSALQTNITGKRLFFISFTNLLLTFFTFGIGYSWARIRFLRFYFENLGLESSFDPNSLAQTQTEEYKNAAGDDILTALDLNIA